MRNGKQAYIDKNFEINARKAFPYRSMYEITKKLNKLLEEAIYGAKINETKQRKKR